MHHLAKGTRRVADTLDIVAQARTAPASRQIFERLAAPRSSGYDLLRGLLEKDYLQRRAGGRWILGDEVHALAMSRFGLGEVAAQIAPVLTALQEETQETSQLMVLNDTQVWVTHAYRSIRSISLGPEIGASMPINWTAAGCLLVCGLNERFLRRFVAAHARPSPAGQAPTDIERLVREVQDAQHRGYAVEIGEACRGAASIAAPVTDAHGKCLAAVSLLLPVARMLSCQETLISLVRAAAAKLTRGLTC